MPSRRCVPPGQLVEGRSAAMADTPQGQTPTLTQRPRSSTVASLVAMSGTVVVWVLGRSVVAIPSFDAYGSLAKRLGDRRCLGG